MRGSQTGRQLTVTTQCKARLNDPLHHQPRHIYLLQHRYRGRLPPPRPLSPLVLLVGMQHVRDAVPGLAHVLGTSTSAHSHTRDKLSAHGTVVYQYTLRGGRGCVGWRCRREFFPGIWLSHKLKYPGEGIRTNQRIRWVACWGKLRARYRDACRSRGVVDARDSQLHCAVVLDDSGRRSSRSGSAIQDVRDPIKDAGKQGRI